MGFQSLFSARTLAVHVLRDSVASHQILRLVTQQPVDDGSAELAATDHARARFDTELELSYSPLPRCAGARQPSRVPRGTRRACPSGTACRARRRWWRRARRRRTRLRDEPASR